MGLSAKSPAKRGFSSSTGASQTGRCRHARARNRGSRRGHLSPRVGPRRRGEVCPAQLAAANPYMALRPRRPPSQPGRRCARTLRIVEPVRSSMAPPWPGSPVLGSLVPKSPFAVRSSAMYHRSAILRGGAVRVVVLRHGSTSRVCRSRAPVSFVVVNPREFGAASDPGRTVLLEGPVCLASERGASSQRREQHSREVATASSRVSLTPSSACRVRSPLPTREEPAPPVGDVKGSSAELRLQASRALSVTVPFAPIPPRFRHEVSTCIWRGGHRPLTAAARVRIPYGP